MWFKIILIWCCILSSVTEAFADRELGFVGLFNGQTTYNDQNNQDSALGAFFLLRAFEDWDLFLGAITLANFTSVVNNSTSTTTNESSTISIDTTFLHRGYGTSLAYVYSTESFLGIQFWLGGAYLNNEVEVIHNVNEEVTRGQGSSSTIFHCVGKSDEIITLNSLPFYVGIGTSLNDFGFFIQYLEQDVDKVPINSDTNLRCLNGSTVETRRHVDANKTIDLSFQTTALGIQYRF